ncbi:MAG: RNase H-like domain-containing protein, partial [Nitrosomonadaceae bacterium]
MTDTRGYFILGRDTAKIMGYVNYPTIQAPVCKYMPETSLKVIQTSKDSLTHGHTMTDSPTYGHTTKQQVGIAALAPHRTSAETTEVGHQQKPMAAEQITNAHTATFAKRATTTTTNVSEQVRKTTHCSTTSHKADNCTIHVQKPTVQRVQSGIKLNGQEHKIPTTKEYILHEYADVFKGVGTLPGGPYHIRLKQSYTPVQHPPRQVPVGLQIPYRKELDRLVKEGIITEVHQHTEWVNSIVPVRKTDGSLRLCLDPKDLNRAIERNQWYSRTMDDILPELANSKYFTLNDATSGYWHVVLDLQSSLLTTFNTPWGKYRWLRLPFGLKVSSDVFQERLDKVLRLLPGILTIADDILTHGQSETEHDEHLLTLLETARMNHLCLNPQKMQFKSEDCKFFGHYLTPDGLKVDPEKVAAIVEMDQPQTVPDLRIFLGVVNYLSRFSPIMAELTEPLNRLTRRDTMWMWDRDQESAFQTIKRMMTDLPVLAYFNADLDHIIQTDASKVGLGAVLLQEGHPVVYASRALTEIEQRYSNIERELLGVVFGLERLHHYTCGYTVTVQTDHEPLTSIWKKSIASSSPRLQRLLLRLAQYDVTIDYLKGKDNIIADALSRICPKHTTESVDLNCIQVHEITDTIPASKTRLQELREATQADRTLFLLAHEVYNGWPESIKDCHKELRDYFSIRADISLEDGLLFKGHRLIVPQSEHNEMLRILHLGHYGFEKMTLRARETVYWPGITNDIETTVSRCKTCTENRK